VGILTAVSEPIGEGDQKVEENRTAVGEIVGGEITIGEGNRIDSGAAAGVTRLGGIISDSRHHPFLC
jgi:hypothetical protein